MGIIVFLVGGDKAVHPWQPCLLTVISVKNNWDTVKGSNLTDVLGGGNASSD